jgi:hypothetical protein
VHQGGLDIDGRARQRPYRPRVRRKCRRRIALGPVDIGVGGAIDDDVGTDRGHRVQDRSSISQVELRTSQGDDFVAGAQLRRHGLAQLTGRAGDHDQLLHFAR